MQSSEVADRAHDNLVRSFAALSRHQPSGHTEAVGRVSLAFTRSPVPLFNEILLPRTSVESSEVLDAVERARALGDPFCVHVRDDVHHDTEAAIHVPAEVARTFLGPTMVSDPAFCVLTGYVDGQPAATSIAFLDADVVGVYNVATVPSARNRGIGGAMNLGALAEGFNNGCRMGTLQSSDAGFALYRELGFEPVSNYNVYVAAT